MSHGVAERKACCARAYASDAARFLVGESLHPGGQGLTDELVRTLDVGREGIVVDVASGPGKSGERAAALTGCTVVCIDLARSGADTTSVRFVRADAEALPLRDGSIDGVLCECAFCLFPDKRAAAREIARVLRPGARMALADVTVASERLPRELRSLDAYVACLDALPLEATAAILADAGLTIGRVEHRDEVIGPLLERIGARLRLARLIGGGPLGHLIDRAEELAAVAEQAAAEGAIGYGIVTAWR